MHMMSKKELSLEEMVAVKRSRNPTVVLTAIEKCTPTRRHTCSMMT